MLADSALHRARARGAIARGNPECHSDGRRPSGAPAAACTGRRNLPKAIGEIAFVVGANSVDRAVPVVVDAGAAASSN